MQWGGVSTCQVAAGWHPVRVDLCDWDNDMLSVLKNGHVFGGNIYSDGWAVLGWLFNSDVRSTAIDSA